MLGTLSGSIGIKNVMRRGFMLLKSEFYESGEEAVNGKKKE